jgi:hypothetical protein
MWKSSSVSTIGVAPRDMEGVLVAMHHEVIWANGMEGGHVHGRDEVRRYWTRPWALVDPRVGPVEFSRGKDGEIVVEVHQIVRDLKGNLPADKMVGQIFQIEDGLIKRFDMRRSGENPGQSTRDLGGYSRRLPPARSFPGTDRTLKRLCTRAIPTTEREKVHRVLAIIRQLSDNRHLACVKRVREFWNQSPCSLAIKVLRVY